MDIDGLRRRTRRGVLTATAHLTATEGPLRVALDQLARRGVGARILKGALAAALAWAVAGLITPGSLPFVASLTALFTVQATIKESVEGGRSRLLGVVVGITVAMAVSELVGLHAWSMGVVVLVALLAGLRLRLESGGVEQVAATAILVMFVQATSDQRLVYAASHLADTAVGTGFGLLLNALLAPPNYVPAAEKVVRSLGRRLVFVLEDVAGALAEGTTGGRPTDLLAAAQVIDRELDDVDEALARAEDGLTYNVVGERQLPALARCRQVAEELRGVARRTLALADALDGSAVERRAGIDLGPLADPAAEAVSAVAVALLDRIERIGTDDGMGHDAADGEVATRADALREAAATELSGLDGEAALRTAPVVAGVLALGDAAPAGLLIGGRAPGRPSRPGLTTRGDAR